MAGDTVQIFKATYSGIPVYEMMCKGVAVMRRRSDSWLNATQILKVAGFDKPQRTRVLEREVQKGEHEKVQGGYGKYQGTWIPLERGLGLAKQYNCEQLLRPIIEFTPAAKSPPLAPKHLVATNSIKAPRRSAAADATTQVINTRSSRRALPDAEESEPDTMSARGTDDGSMTPSPSEGSSSSRTPSPIRSQGGSPSRSGRNGRPRRLMEDDDDPRKYGDQILEYFISDSTQIPEVLVAPPFDFDPNMAIDDDGHTALHWACAMGRIRIVKLLLTAGADVFKVNKSGQTALMRSVMFANNYDVRKFPELYELLHRSTLNIDNSNRTVFHHIVDVHMSKGKAHASRYYMETVLTRLSDYPKELADVINFQDQDGETALTLAARCRSKRLVKILIDHGADPKIANVDGKSTEDFILEDERFRASPRLAGDRDLPTPYRLAPASSVMSPNFPVPNHQLNESPGDRSMIHHSVTSEKTSTRAVNGMTTMLDGLAASYDKEIKDKDRDMNQATALLDTIQSEILESQRAVGHLKAQAESLPEAKENLQRMEKTLVDKMGKRYLLGWDKWVKEEELRETTIRSGSKGELKLTPSKANFQVEDDLEVEVDDERSKGKRKATALEEDVADLIGLHQDIPDDQQALREACDQLREEILGQRKRRKDAFEELTGLQAGVGTGAKMADYRKLIGAGCGGVPPSEVDHVLGMLLETLESEEPSASGSGWLGPKPPLHNSI